MGIFSCCVGEQRSEKREAEARHARLVEIYQQAQTGAAPPSQAPPPAYNEIVHGVSADTTILLDEKSQPVLIQTRPPSPVQPMRAHPSLSRPASPQTSVYSVPSTRLTDITSAYTGQTVTATPTHQIDSPRSSLVFDSAPPSYYDGRSMRERSRSPSGHREENEERYHPVMADGWLERLVRAAEQN